MRRALVRATPKMVVLDFRGNAINVNTLFERDQAMRTSLHRSIEPADSGNEPAAMPHGPLKAVQACLMVGYGITKSHVETGTLG